MNIEEKDEQEVDNSILPDFSLLGITEEDEATTEDTDNTDNTNVSEPTVAASVETEELSETELESLSAFYQMFQEKGILPEKEIKSWEDIEAEIEAYKTNLPNQVKESIIGSTNQDVQGLIDYALTKPDASKEDLIRYIQAEQRDAKYASIDSDDKAREFLKAKYASQFDEDALDAMLDTMEDKGTLQSKAKETLEYESEKLREQAKQEAEQRELNNTQWIKSIDTEFDSQSWNTEHKQRVKDQFNSGELDKRVQQIIQDPKSLVQLANILSYYNPEAKEFNLDTFFTQANTKKTNSVKDRIVAAAQNRGSSTTPKNKPGEFDLGQYSLVN